MLFPIIMAGASASFAIAAVNKGIKDREFVSLRSGTKWFLRQSTVCLTGLTIANVAMRLFVLLSIKAPPLMMVCILTASGLALVNSSKDFNRLSTRYEQILRPFFDRLIGTS